MTDTPTIAELIRQHALKITDTAELYRLILLEHPDATPRQIVGDLRRQAAEDFAHAEELEAWEEQQSAQGRRQAARYHQGRARNGAGARLSGTANGARRRG